MVIVTQPPKLQYRRGVDLGQGASSCPTMGPYTYCCRLIFKKDSALQKNFRLELGPTHRHLVGALDLMQQLVDGTIGGDTAAIFLHGTYNTHLCGKTTRRLGWVGIHNNSFPTLGVELVPRDATQQQLHKGGPYLSPLFFFHARASPAERWLFLCVAVGGFLRFRAAYPLGILVSFYSLVWPSRAADPLKIQTSTEQQKSYCWQITVCADSAVFRPSVECIHGRCTLGIDDRMRFP